MYFWIFAAGKYKPSPTRILCLDLETNPTHNWFPKRNAAFLMAYDPIQELIFFFFFSQINQILFFFFFFNSTCHFKSKKSVANTQEDELGFQEFQELKIFYSRLSRNCFCMIQEYQEITRLKNNKVWKM